MSLAGRSTAWPPGHSTSPPFQSGFIAKTSNPAITGDTAIARQNQPKDDRPRLFAATATTIDSPIQNKSHSIRRPPNIWDASPNRTHEQPCTG